MLACRLAKVQRRKKRRREKMFLGCSYQIKMSTAYEKNSTAATICRKMNTIFPILKQN